MITDGTSMTQKQFQTLKRNGTSRFSLRKPIGVITRGQGNIYFYGMLLRVD